MKSSSQMGRTLKRQAGSIPVPLLQTSSLRRCSSSAGMDGERETSPGEGTVTGRHQGPRALTCHSPSHQRPKLAPEISLPDIQDFPRFAASLGKNEHHVLKISLQVSWLKFSACSLSLVLAHKNQPPAFAGGHLNSPTSRLMDWRRESVFSGPHPTLADMTSFFLSLTDQQHKRLIPHKKAIKKKQLQTVYAAASMEML